MPRTRVKICGIMRPSDAIAAARDGADAIGIILHPASRRFIDIQLAKAIVAALPPYVTPVGLFVDAAPQHILDVAGQLGLRHVQLNGSESVDIAAALQPLIVFKAIRVDRVTLRQNLATWTQASPNVRGIVLETAHTAVAGGSGIENDWAVAHEAIEAGLFKQMPIIAAGGLRPDNVANVIRMIRPWAVDVSSGVEETRGEKSPALLKAFFDAVATADQ